MPEHGYAINSLGEPTAKVLYVNFSMNVQIWSRMTFFQHKLFWLPFSVIKATAKVK